MSENKNSSLIILENVFFSIKDKDFNECTKIIWLTLYHHICKNTIYVYMQVSYIFNGKHGKI